jgi:hypothetical protein
MSAKRVGLRRPKVGEHVKVIGDRLVYEVTGVLGVHKTAHTETAHVYGPPLNHVPWTKLVFLDAL